MVRRSPRRDRLSPTPAAPLGPRTQVKSASVVSLSWRFEDSCRPSPAAGCHTAPTAALVRSPSCRLRVSPAKVFKPACASPDVSDAWDQVHPRLCSQLIEQTPPQRLLSTGQQLAQPRIPLQQPRQKASAVLLSTKEDCAW